MGPKSTKPGGSAPKGNPHGSLPLAHLSLRQKRGVGSAASPQVAPRPPFRFWWRLAVPATLCMCRVSPVCVGVAASARAPLGRQHWQDVRRARKLGADGELHSVEIHGVKLTFRFQRVCCGPGQAMKAMPRAVQI